MDRAEYCARVLSGLPRLSREEREAVRAELEEHMEDHACALLDLGYDEQLAEERTMAAMGDPAEVARELAKQYPRCWDMVTGVSAVISIVMIFVTVLGIGSLGFLWDSVAYRLFRPPDNRSREFFDVCTADEDRDIRVRVGDDVLRVYRVSVGLKEGERVAKAAVCTYDRIPGGVVSHNLLVHLTAESQRGEVLEHGSHGGGSGSWQVEYTSMWAPIQPGDSHITLRYRWLGEDVAVEVPLPEEGAS